MKKKIKFIFFLFFFLYFLLLIIQNYCLQYKKNSVIDSYFIENTSNIELENEYNNSAVSDVIGVLEIPKISLSQPLYNIDSIYNDVSLNVQVLKESNFPDSYSSNVILAAHSGSSFISYFNLIYKLEIDDVIYLFYNKKKYIYQIIDYYEVRKSSDLNLKVYDGDLITLITCKKYTSNIQVVYVGKMVKTDEF